jgi:hypothetical protein
MGPYLHRDMTRQWAIEEGLADIADEVAEADVGFDTAYPGRLVFFSHLHLGPLSAILARARLRKAIRLRSPLLLGRALHGIQDWHSHGYAGEKHWQHRFRLLRRHPDDWDAAPPRLRQRIEEASRSYLRAYRDALATDS